MISVPDNFLAKSFTKGDITKRSTIMKKSPHSALFKADPPENLRAKAQIRATYALS